MTTQAWRRIMYGDDVLPTQEQDRARRLQVKAHALAEVQAATTRVEAAQAQQDQAMRYAAEVRCSLRQIGDATGRSFSWVRSRLQRQGEGKS